MKYLFINILLMMFSLITYSQCIEGNCKNGQGTFIYDNGLKYNGDFLDGVRHGYGSLNYKDGSNYTGAFEFDKAHGSGIRNFVNGGYCDGEWKNDLFHGNGIFQINDSIKYDGYFENGVIKFGIKTIIYNDVKLRHVGSFKPNSDVPKHHQDFSFSIGLDGYGATLYQYNESSFVYLLGEHKDDLINGEALYFETGGFHKMGIWENGDFLKTWLIKRQIKSVEYVTDCILGDCIKGFGIKTYFPGHKYIGEFNNGEQHGTGILIRQSGMLCYSDFVEGNMNSLSSIIFFANGSIYEGEIIDNVLGDGKWYKYDE